MLHIVKIYIVNMAKYQLLNNTVFMPLLLLQ